MLIARIPPTVAELVARALASTRFLAEIDGAPPHLIKTVAELAASLAAEQWEAEHRALIGASLPPDLIVVVSRALVAHADELREARLVKLYEAHLKIEHAIAAVATLRTAIAGQMPTEQAETQMDHAESDIDRVGVALKRAKDDLDSEIDRLETDKSAALRAQCAIVDAAWEAQDVDGVEYL